MKIKKQWVSWEEFEKIQGGSWTPAPHATKHHAGGADPLDFASITGFGTYLDQAVKQASAVSFTGITDTAVTATNIAAGTTGQRPGGVIGDMRYNSTLGGFEVYPGAWKSMILSGDNAILASILLNNTGLRIKDTDASHYLTIKPGSDITANRILTLTTGDAARTITLSGNPTLADWFDQAVKQASSPTFAGVVINGGDISIKEAQKIVNADNVSAYFQMPVSDVATISDKAFKFYDYVTAKYIQVDIPAGYVSFATDEAYYKFDKVVMATSFHLPAGVTPNIGWLSDVNIDEFEQGETLLYDADTGNLVDAWGVEYDNPRLVWKMYTEFMGYDAMSSPPWTGGGIAGGTKAGISGLANHPGIMNFLSGTTANSGYRYAIENDAILLAGKESTEFIFQMKTNTDTRVKLGFIDTYSSGNPVDGVWLEILGGVLTGKTANNSAISTTGTNFPIVEDTWYRVKLFINNAVTLVTYSIYTCADDTIRWTDTLAVNIPTARVTGHGIIATHDEEYVVSMIWVDMMTANRAGAWNR